MRRNFNSKRWTILPEDIETETLLHTELGLHPVTARLLVQRGISTPEQADLFLNPSLDRMHDPFLLPDAELACERIKQALHNKERIMVHGDYDGDGLTSSALLTRCLRALGADVEVFVPHRKRDGYDMRKAFIERARTEKIALIITVDCGIQRKDEVELAEEYGIDVIVTDHHTPNSDGSLPKAIAVVNPHRKDSKYPFPDLAGVGVAFKLCEALTRHLGMNPDSFRRGYLDLAALGTVTDMMPLIDENRIIVKHGLSALQNSKKPGIRAIIDISGYASKMLDTYSIGFGIGPRLNAASRVDETHIALDLLMTKDESEAYSLARRLDELNIRRREEQTRIFDEALAQVAMQDVSEARCLVVSGTGWSSGIIGLVAGRIMERYSRPCIAIGINESTGDGRGSARSMRPFNIFNAIDSCKDLLVEYGGHANAAGLSIKGENVADFASQMNHIAGTQLTEEDCVPTLEAAMEIDPSDLSIRLLEQLESMAPFGNGNPDPLFVSRGVPIREILTMGKEKQHLKLRLKIETLDGRSSLDAPWFNQGERAAVLEPGMSLDICFRPQINEWNNSRSVQFLLQDIHTPEW